MQTAPGPGQARDPASPEGLRRRTSGKLGRYMVRHRHPVDCGAGQWSGGGRQSGATGVEW